MAHGLLLVPIAERAQLEAAFNKHHVLKGSEDPCESPPGAGAMVRYNPTPVASGETSYYYAYADHDLDNPTTPVAMGYASRPAQPHTDGGSTRFRLAPRTCDAPP